MPLVIETCEALREAGHTLAVASNQGGVAMGYLTEDEARALVENAARMIGADFYEFCPYHPEGLFPEYAKDAECRKPRPGMLLEIMRKSGAEADDTLFVGDRPEDFVAAQAAGVEFVWSQDFFR
jgi:D-glycero-D-manno-heptose 1,7-bisphosphate phosphatase